ncbi:MAG: HlyD family secretion protein [Thermoanaerobaculia bacterium]
MATPYSRTLRSLEKESSSGAIAWIAGISLIFAGAVVWSVAAEIGVFATTSEARIETAAGSHPVDAEVGGTIAAVHTGVGRRVEAGEVLVELDVRLPGLRLAEERSTLEAFEERLVILERRLESETEALRAAERERAKALEEATARVEEARARLDLAASEAKRAAELHRAGLLSDADRERAEIAYRQQRSALEASNLALQRLEWAHQNQEGERRSRIEALEEEAAGVRGSLARSRSSVERLERELDRFLVRAPVSGVVAEQGDLRAGETVTAGERLATVVPDGGLRVVARFAPADVLGRARPGQPAVVRLHGFPWTQYGTVPAEVSRVATEVREGRVLVELVPTPGTASAGGAPPLSHGLPATVEIRVESVSPAILALRAAGGGARAPAAAESGRRSGT